MATLSVAAEVTASKEETARTLNASSNASQRLRVDTFTELRQAGAMKTPTALRQ
jgi:hypothetical protein